MRRGLAALLGGCLMVAYFARYPLGTSGGPGPGSVPIPDLERALALLHAVGSLALLNVTAFALGAALHARLCPRLRIEHLTVPLRLGLGLLVVANVVLALAAAHLLRPWALTGLLAGPALVWALRRVRGRGSPSLPAASISAPWLPRWRGLALGALLLPPFLQAFGPMHGWDALTYHLALPERYLFTNGIYVTPFSTYSAFPMNTEMLYALALGTAGPALARLIHFEFGCLILWTLFALGRSFSPRCGWLCLLFLVGDPLFVWELTVAYADLPLAFYSLLALASFATWWTTGERAALLPAGVFAGACLATRYPGAALLVALGVPATLAPGNRTWRERASAVLIVCALAAAVLTPWLLRNLAYTGNPIAPALQGLFYRPGEEYFDPVAVEQQVAFSRTIGMGRSLGAFLSAPWNLTIHPSPELYTGGFGFHVGPLCLLSLVLVLLVPLSSQLVRLALWASGVLFVIWFATSQEARFLMPALVLLALCGGFAMDRILPSPLRHPMSVLWILPLLAILHSHWPRWWGIERAYEDALVLKESQLERAHGPAEEVGTLLRRGLQGRHRLLLVFESRGFLFRGLRYVPYHIHEGSPTLQLIHRSRSPEDLRARLAALGITHLVVNWSMPGLFRPVWVERYRPEDFQADCDRLRSFQRECTRPLLSHEGVEVGAVLPSCSADSAPTDPAVASR